MIPPASGPSKTPRHPLLGDTRIVLDGIIFSLQTHGGISVYFRELYSRLRRDSANVSLQLALPLVTAAIDLRQVSGAQYRYQRRVFERVRACPVSGGAGIFHSSYYRQPRSGDFCNVVTVHDFIHELYGKGLRARLFAYQKNAAIRSADRIICVSNSTLLDLRQRFPDVREGRYRVVHNGKSDEFRIVGRDVQTRPYLLYVGQREGYKRFDLAVGVLQRLSHFDMLCVGGSGASGEHGKYPRDVMNRIQFVSAPTDSELNRIYNNAFCLLYPSEYEGFGIPAVEAMSVGCPVVIGPCRALIEVCGNGAQVASEFSIDAMIEAVTALQDSNLRASKVADGKAVAANYSWEKCYQETVVTYLDALSNRRRVEKV